MKPVTSASGRERGFTLVEIVVLIVVIGVAVSGVLLVFQNTVRGSADPQIYKQALAIAEAMLDEVLPNSYDPVAGGGTRAQFNDVDDYNAYATTGVQDIQGGAVPGLGDYNVGVVVAAPAALNDGDAGLVDVPDSKRVTVTVTHAPTGVSIRLDGYRTNYAAP
jgi:MSHA pilin protein MshD